MTRLNEKRVVVQIWTNGTISLTCFRLPIFFSLPILLGTMQIFFFNAIYIWMIVDALVILHRHHLKTWQTWFFWVQATIISLQSHFQVKYKRTPSWIGSTCQAAALKIKFQPKLQFNMVLAWAVIKYEYVVFWIY